MKKSLIMFIFILAISISSISFANDSNDSLDKEYINLIISKFDSLDAAKKISTAKKIKILLSDDVGVEVLYLEINKKSQSQLDKYGITESILRRNIDSFKNWSSNDRLSLIDAIVDDDKSEINSLNNKYAKSDEDPSKVDPSKAITKEEAVKVLLDKGFLSGEIKVIPGLKNKTFLDIKNHWSNKYVLFLVSRGIIEGYNESSFKPEANISKAEVITLITKLIVADAKKIDRYTGSVLDIESNNWYDDYMKLAYTLKLVKADEFGKLNPNHLSTREEVIEILINAIKIMNLPISDDLKVYKGNFTDYNDVDDSIKESMTIAINLGLISGVDKDTIAPKAEIKRSEIAVLIKKLYLYIIDKI